MNFSPQNIFFCHSRGRFTDHCRYYESPDLDVS
jgi:hypothetical protein